ncbi:MAG: phage protease [Phycisphaerae bacterium]|nr:phage protease [Phycisphaerae bacterium]
MSTRQIIVANRIALPAEPPEEIWLMPWGSVAASNGDFVVNDESRRAILERIDHRGVELVIDYEHHTVGGEFAAPDGRAVAAGWIKSLRFARDGDAAGVYAGVEWTPAAARAIRDREYRFVSPVVLVRESDGVCIGLHSVALTNTPAIIAARPIVNKEGTSMDPKFEMARGFLGMDASATQEQIMSEMEKFMAQLRELAGAGGDADQAQVMSALSARLKRGDESAARFTALRAAVVKSAGLSEQVADEAVLHACGELRRGAAGGETEMVALRAANEALSSRVQTAEKALNEIRCREFIARGTEEGRISAHTAEKWAAEFLRDPNGAEQRLRDLIPAGTYPRPGVTAAGRPSSGGAGGNTRPCRAKFDAAVQTKVAAGMKRHEAFVAVCREQPELRQALVEEANAA